MLQCHPLMNAVRTDAHVVHAMMIYCLEAGLAHRAYVMPDAVRNRCSAAATLMHTQARMTMTLSRSWTCRRGCCRWTRQAMRSFSSGPQQQPSAGQSIVKRSTMQWTKWRRDATRSTTGQLVPHRCAWQQTPAGALSRTERSSADGLPANCSFSLPCHAPDILTVECALAGVARQCVRARRVASTGRTCGAVRCRGCELWASWGAAHPATIASRAVALQ